MSPALLAAVLGLPPALLLVQEGLLCWAAHRHCQSHSRTLHVPAAGRAAAAQPQLLQLLRRSTAARGARLWGLIPAHSKGQQGVMCCNCWHTQLDAGMPWTFGLT